METEVMPKVPSSEIVMIPGGYGSRTVIRDKDFVTALGKQIEQAHFVLCVCTGSALEAAAGLLDGKNATSNKTAFEWVKSVRPQVIWNRQARWIK